MQNGRAIKGQTITWIGNSNSAPVVSYRMPAARAFGTVLARETMVRMIADQRISFLQITATRRRRNMIATAIKVRSTGVPITDNLKTPNLHDTIRTCRNHRHMAIEVLMPMDPIDIAADR